MRSLFRFFILVALSGNVSEAVGIVDYRHPYFGQPLLSGNISAIERDPYGFVWVASHEELARFDGLSYHSLDNDINRLLFEKGNLVQCLVFTGPDLLWAGSNEGLFRIDTRTHRLSVVEAFRGIRINEFLTDRSGNLWTATDRGVLAYSPRSEKMVAYFSPAATSPETTVSPRSSFSEDRDGNLWFSHGNSLVRLSAKGGLLNRVSADSLPEVRIDTVLHFETPKRIRIDRFDILWLWDRQELRAVRLSDVGKETRPLYHSLNIETTALLPRENDVLIGNRGKGFLVLSRNGEGRITGSTGHTINKYYNDLSNTTNGFCDEGNGNVWLATRDGLYLAEGKREAPFINIRNDIGSENTISHNTVSDIYIQNRNTVWIATAFGLNRVEFTDPTHRHYTIARYFDRRPGSGYIQRNKFECIAESSQGDFWLGTKDAVSFFDPRGNRFYNRPKIDEAVKGSSFVRALMRDSRGNMWIGFANGGVYVHDAKTGEVYPAGKGQSDMLADKCMSIAEDRSGIIWVGIQNRGIVRFRYEGAGRIEEIRDYSFAEAGTDGKTSRTVVCIYTDPYNNIWAGTSEGLYRYDYDRDRFEETPMPDAARSNHISNIIDDDRGNLWLSTLSGVYKYSLSNNQFQYTELYGGSFTRRGFVFGSAKDSDGYLYLSGINGVTLFNPAEIKADTAHYRLFFVDFKVHNRTATVGSDILAQDINRTDRIVLGHKDNQFSFAFSALAFPQRENIRYAYMLEGLDTEWLHAGSGNRYIAYNNLPAGTYTLKIRSTDASGTWLDNVRSLVIRIRPHPLWSWYSIPVYLLLAGLLGWLLFHMWRIREQYRTQAIINRSRLKFYTDVSYSIKNPLMLLQSPLQNLIENYDSMSPDEVKYQLGVMNRNGNRLSRLVDQLVQFRKLDQGKLPLHLAEADIVHFTESIFVAFRELFASKQIGFTFASDRENFPMVFDREKIETVLFNLLSNAYKFTPEGGRVEIRCESGTVRDRFLLRVSDTGAGIREKDRERVFERFWTRDQTGTERHSGAGIGLSLARELAELHHGSLTVDLRPEGGTVFTLTLLTGKAHFQNAEIERPQKEEVSPAFIGDYIDTIEIKTEPQNEAKTKLPLAVLVDEDAQTLEYLGKLLHDTVRVRSFGSVTEAFSRIVELKPQLVISGLVFDGENDGLNLCRQVKTHPATNCIPFMFLTGRTRPEDKQAGYESGADAYVTKPFEVKYLKMRIAQLLRSRERIRERIKQELIISPREMQLLSADDRFLAKAREVVEKNIAEENFSVDLFADKMHLSTSMLYRKIKSLTDLSSNEFIRSIRLKRAAQLLATRAYTVSEVASRVGFTDIRYFSTCFKREFGSTPSAYQQQKAPEEEQKLE